MDRRAFITMVGECIVAGPLAAAAQPVGKVYRLGYLSAGGTSLNSPYAQALRQGLRDLGWVEGQNIVIEFRSADQFDRLPALATELVRLKVDVIVATPTPGALAAKSATATIPIVGISLTDPVGLRLIPSLDLVRLKV